MKTVDEMQKEIFAEIDDSENQIYLKVTKKQLKRDEYLGSIKERCLNEGLSEEEAQDVVFLVDTALWGFGILDPLINDPDISDIRLIDEDHVRIKKLGKRYPADVRFSSKAEFARYIDFITSRNNTSMSIVNAAQVFTDKDSCKTDILRFSLVSDLVNTNGHPTLLIRKIPKAKKTFDNLINAGFCTAAQAQYLLKRWKDGHGVLVDGPNGSGKTTLTNAILEATPKEKSCVVIQESEELFCDGHPEMVFRKVIPQKNGSTVSYSLKDLARLALMESFDCIVVGEIKGDEAAELSYATYTGSQSMTTVHSNSAREGIEKLIDYALDAQPNRTRDHFAKQFQSLDTLVFVEGYKIREIYEVQKWDPHRQEYTFVPARVEGEADAPAPAPALPDVPSPEPALAQQPEPHVRPLQRRPESVQIVRPAPRTPLRPLENADRPAPERSSTAAMPAEPLHGEVVADAVPRGFKPQQPQQSKPDPFEIFEQFGTGTSGGSES